MEDREPDEECHAVGGEVQALGEQHLVEALQAQDVRLMGRELARRGQDGPDADGDRNERQGLLEQVRLAPALPGPPADQVAHGRAGEPSSRPGDASRDVQQLHDEVGQLGRAQSQYRRGRKTDKPPAALAAEPSPQWPWGHPPRGVADLLRYKAHGFPSLTKAAGSVTKVYSTGPRSGLNREVLQVSDTPRARGDPRQRSGAARLLRQIECRDEPGQV